MGLLEKFTHYIQHQHLFQSKDRLLLAVSGGVDSVVLCALCQQAGYDFEIAHCNFQLRGADSQRDEAFVKAMAEKFGVPFHLKIFDTAGYAKTTKKSIETAARDLRYEWFYSLINSKQTEGAPAVASKLNYILTGHHADDNIETVTMNFFRGTGIAGLKGILPKQGSVIRPLLFARRTELENYAAQQGLEFVTDHTNLENDYTRNYFRNTILPLVSESFPEAATNVLKNIQRFRETEILFQQSVEQHKKKLLEYRGKEIHIPVLKLLKTVPLVTVLHEVIKEFGFTAHQTEEAIALLKSETGKYIQSATHRIIKNRRWIIISPSQTVEANHILIEENDNQIVFTSGSLSMEKVDSGSFKITLDPLVAQLDFSKISFPMLLRKWKIGDYFYPLGMQKKKKLSRFLSDQKLSLTQKENVWVVAMDQKIIWVVGMRIDDRFKISEATQQIYSLRLLKSS